MLWEESIQFKVVFQLQRWHQCKYLLVFDRLGPGHLEPRAYLTDLVDLDVGCHNFDQHTNTQKCEDVEKWIPN